MGSWPRKKVREQRDEEQYYDSGAKNWDRTERTADKQPWGNADENWPRILASKFHQLWLVALQGAHMNIVGTVIFALAKFFLRPGTIIVQVPPAVSFNTREHPNI